MNKYVRRISYDFDGYDETEYEYVTYYGEPFTGVLYEVRNGKLESEASIVKGEPTGFVIWYHSNGRIEEIKELSGNSPIGILVRWDENGNLTKAEKRWSGTLIEKLTPENGVLVYEKVASDKTIHELLTSPLYRPNNYRQENIRELLAEVEEKIRENTVFEDPRLYT